VSLPNPKGRAGKRARVRKATRQARKLGNSEYVAAVHATGCVVPRLATKPGTPCEGRMTFSHLEKANRTRHGWRRAVAMCFHHHLNEFEGKVEAFCDRYGILFQVLEGEAARNVDLYGGLVDASSEPHQEA
jgi:hypothetical protein